MNLFIQKGSKPAHFLSAISILAFLVFAGAPKSNAQSPRILVCNKGTIPVYIASLRTWYRFLDKVWVLNGWQKVEPNSWPCGEVGGTGTTYLVFGIWNSDGKFGIVKYEFDNTCRDCGAGKPEICVKYDGMDYTSSSVDYLPPCPDGFIAVPTSLSVYAEGDATLNLTVRPSPSDYGDIAIYLGERKKPVTPRSANSAISQETKPAVQTYRVVGVAYNDVLFVRHKPNQLINMLAKFLLTLRAFTFTEIVFALERSVG
jgi:hypothetical protein